MKTNWPTKKLGEICIKITDGSHNPPNGLDKGKPMLSSRNIFNDGIHFDNVRYLSDEDFELENRRTNVEAGDLLLTIVGTIGRVLVVPDGLPKFTLQRSVAVVKTGEDLDANYLALYLSSSTVQDYLVAQARGGAQKGFYLKDIKDLEIPVPPIEVQKKIVAKLESLLAKISEAKKLREQARESANALLSAELHKIFEEGKKETELVKIGDICEIKGGKRLPRGHKLQMEETEYPYIRVADFIPYGVDTSDIRFIDDETFSQIKRYTISKDDVFFSIAGTIGNIGVIPPELDGANLTENAAKLTNLKNVGQRYLMYLLSSPQVQSQIRSDLIQTTISKFGLFRIAKLEFPLFPLTEQKKIVARLDRISQKVEEVKRLQDQTAQEFSALEASILHKAFQGEL